MARRKQKKNRRQRPRHYRAKCEGCGKVGPVYPRREEGEFHSPCPRCGCDTAIYEPQLNDPPASSVPSGRVLTE